MTMELLYALGEAFAASPENTVTEETASRRDFVGMRLYDAPVFAVADAADPLFPGLKAPEAVSPDTWLPEDWLPGAKRVLSFFLPFSERVREANRAHMDAPCDEWLHGRIEGNAALQTFGAELCAALEREGFRAVQPAADPRFKLVGDYRSNWSERHAGFIAGLGTFGLSKGIITEKGMAGRVGSVVTDCEIAATPRPYTELYEYCVKCGACARNCPAHAISPETGKDHGRCDAFVAGVTKSVQPRGQGSIVRFGCGKCQVGVPCESRNPAAR